MSAEKRKYRLLAMDLDKTLLQDDASIPDEVLKRFRELRADGVHFVICTGRMRRAAEHYAKMIGGGSVVCFNGALVITEDGKEYRSEIPLALMHEVIDRCYDDGVYVQLYDGDTILVDRRAPELETDRDIDFNPVRECGDLRKIDLRPSPKMIGIDMSGKFDYDIERMNEAIPELTMANSSEYVIEIMLRGIDKGHGLRIAAESLGIGREETVAVGDGMNDRPMLEWAGLGVAVANADERLMASADHVTEGKMSYGVLEVMDQFF